MSNALQFLLKWVGIENEIEKKKKEKKTPQVSFERTEKIVCHEPNSTVNLTLCS